MHMNLFFDHFFNFLSAKTKINKNVVNLITLDGLEAVKRQKYYTGIAMWLNHFENHVVWATFQLFLKLHFHITVLWRFCRISVISWVFVFGYRPQNENLEIMENLYFWVYKVQMHMNLFFDHYFNFLSAKTKIN